MDTSFCDSLAAALQNTTRDSDARAHRPMEFVVVAPDTTAEGARILAGVFAGDGLKRR